MFGYIAPHLSDLSEDERARYQAAYCGLCRALGDCCAQRCRLALSYDMVFMALVLGSLYEPAEQQGIGRCLPHPVKPRAFVRTPYLDYAADATVALAYYKALDDWHDDRSVAGRAFAAALAGPYRKVRERNARLCQAVEEGMRDIGVLEQAVAPDLDAAANRFGVLMGELFVYDPADFWAQDLRVLGARLGKFVYVMDAVLDYRDDRASGSYNPLVATGVDESEMRDGLNVLAAGVAEAFERLPLERDVHVLRSVVYAGIWQKLNAKENEENDKSNKETSYMKSRGKP